jgi:mutator protein MutT
MSRQELTDLKRKNIHVACAVIERNSLVLVAQRSAAMSLPLEWEFPGGKIEPGESLEECLCREIVEELGVSIEVSRSLQPTRHEYPDLTVTRSTHLSVQHPLMKSPSMNTRLWFGFRLIDSMNLTGPKQTFRFLPLTADN